MLSRLALAALTAVSVAVVPVSTAVAAPALPALPTLVPFAANPVTFTLKPSALPTNMVGVAANYQAARNASVAEANKLANLIKADSSSRGKTYGWYARTASPCWQATFYHKSQTVTNSTPANCSDPNNVSAHLKMGTTAAAAYVPFFRNVSANVRSFHLDGNGYLSVQTKNFLCTGTNFNPDQVGTALSGSWTCLDYYDFAARQPKDRSFYKNENWAATETITYSSAKRPSRVSVCGNQFCVAGQPWVMKASTLFNGRAHPEVSVKLAKAAGMNTIRITDFFPYGLTAQQNISDPAMFAALDRVIAAATTAGMYVILDLSPYRDQLISEGVNPYTVDWTPYLTAMANHRNYITGLAYKDDSTIALVSIAGEPEPPNGAKKPTDPVSATQLTEFFRTTLATWKSLAPGVLVNSGGLIQMDWDSGVDWRAIFALEDNDICDMHGYGPNVTTVAQATSAFCGDLGKPWIMEETGISTNGASDSARASWMKTAYDVSWAGGAAGVGVWNLWLDGTDTYDVNPEMPLTWAAVKAGAAAGRPAAPVPPVSPADEAKILSGQVSSLLQADSAARSKAYSTYGGTYYRPGTVIDTPAHAAVVAGDDWHTFWSSTGSLSEVPFASSVPSGVSAFLLAPDSSSSPARLWLTVQTSTGYTCDSYYFDQAGVGTPAVTPTWVCRTTADYNAQGAWAQDAFWND